MRALLEFFIVAFWVTPKVLWFSFLEEKKVKRLFHKNAPFKQADLFLRSLYRSQNPYRICRQYMKDKGSSSHHVYGETPLSVFHEMFEKGDLKASDCFVDLGSGRGRGVLFAALAKNCAAIGVERIPTFSNKAEKVASHLNAKNIRFLCQDICAFDASLGSFFYFYSLCLEEKEMEEAALHLEKMKPGSKLITVSFPITEYSQKFTLHSSWEATYPWGKTDLFLHIRKT